MRQRPTSLAILTGVLCLSLFGVSGTAAGAGPEPPKLRLPTTARPTGYAVELTIDPNQPGFRGSVDITVRLEQETDLLWLNAAAIEIQKASAKAGGAAVGVSAVPRGGEFLAVAFDRAVGPGELTLHLEYTGTLDETSTQGLFRQKSGEDWYAFSQLETTDARRAFPCFDEPSFKTPWQLTLTIPRGTSAVSNTSIESEKESGGMRTVRFRKTPPLPSYLIALAVGPFEYVDAGKAGRGKTPIRIVTPARQGVAGEVRRRDVGAPAGGAGGVLRHAVPVREARPARDTADGQLRRDGERRAGHLGRVDPARAAGGGDDRVPAPAGRDHRRTRSRTSGSAIWSRLAWWDDLWLNESFATWMADRTITEWKPEWNGTSPA